MVANSKHKEHIIYTVFILFPFFTESNHTAMFLTPRTPLLGRVVNHLLTDYYFDLGVVLANDPPASGSLLLAH